MRRKTWTGVRTATAVFTVGLGVLATSVHPAASAPVAAPINHIVVMMQENRSFDSYFGQLNVEGQPASEPEPTTGNPDPTNPSNPPIVPFHQTQLCSVADLGHNWNQMHAEIDVGAMDGFTATNVYPDDPTGSRTMGYYDQAQLPFYYQLANTFGIGDRNFASVPSQTFPNRFYLLAGTSFGHIANDFPPPGGFPVTTIFDRLDAAGISWKVYDAQFAFASFFAGPQAEAATHIFPISQYYIDAAAGNLPAVTFVDPIFLSSPNKETDEHPSSNVEVGQKFTYGVVHALETSPNWSDSALFLTYDEAGGFYDHVTPPAAVPPDSIPPMLQSGDTPGAFDQYGVRVPLIVVSPYTRAHFVSHVVNDHTSILKFIEDRYGLTPLTNRDAAANDLSEFFDFSSPTFATPPSFTQPSVSKCWAQDVQLKQGTGDVTQLDTHDKVTVTFDLKMALPGAGASVEVTDADGTVADLVKGVNASFTLDSTGKILAVKVTGAPTVVTAGSVAGVQFPAQITAESGVVSHKGKPWDLTQSPDLIISTASGG